MVYNRLLSPTYIHRTHRCDDVHGVFLSVLFAFTPIFGVYLPDRASLNYYDHDPCDCVRTIIHCGLCSPLAMNTTELNTAYKQVARQCCVVGPFVGRLAKILNNLTNTQLTTLSAASSWRRWQNDTLCIL